MLKMRFRYGLMGLNNLEMGMAMYQQLVINMYRKIYISLDRLGYIKDLYGKVFKVRCSKIPILYKYQQF